MTVYTVTFARSARKELESLDRGVGKRILARIESLASNPRPSGCRKLVGANDLWRIRVVTPRTDIGPNMGAFAAFTDPVGNEFGLYEEPQR